MMLSGSTRGCWRYPAFAIAALMGRIAAVHIGTGSPVTIIGWITGKSVAVAPPNV